MAWDRALACRLAKACNVAYYADQPGGATSCPSYSDVGFTSTPDVVISGVDHIDAGIVGSCADSVIVALRGTLPLTFASGTVFLQSLFDWLTDANAVQIPGYGGMVHRGFADSLEHLWPGLKPKILARAGAGTPIFVTGHSKGGAVATLAAMRVHDEIRAPSAVYTYAAARAGSGDFAEHYDQAITEHWRVENRDDIIPHLPPGSELWLFLRRIDARFAQLVPFQYESVGTLQFINWSGTLEEDSFLLKIHRLESLTEKLATGQVRVIADDHSLTHDYFTAVCR